MSASDTRRGPGWWMDLDGDWNPPEEWPESTPPLPGWTQTGDGRWEPPTDELGAVRPPTDQEIAAQPRLSESNETAVPVPPPITPPTRKPAAPETGSRPALSYAEYAPLHSSAERGPSTSWALQAAAIAAAAALIIGLGMTVLLLLL